MASVTLKNLSKSYPGPKKSLVPAVRHIDLEVRDGEFMVLVGPSGCGKTTTLRMIAGLQKVDEGSISMDGKVIDGFTLRIEMSPWFFSTTPFTPI